ncbi:2-oxoglutarate dehydrogenase E1 subunit family protein, partial [Streptomyces aureoversilis]
MSPQSPNTSSISTDQDGQGKSPADVFGPNEWLVDEIYQQYLQDPNSVDRAWWDFFADYKPGTAAAAPPQEVIEAAGGPAPAATTPAAPAAPAPPAPAAAAQ